MSVGVNNCVPGTVNVWCVGADGTEGSDIIGVVTAGIASVTVCIVSRTGVVAGDITDGTQFLLFMSVLLLLDGIVLRVRCPDPEGLLSVNFLKGSHTGLIVGILTLLLTAVGAVGSVTDIGSSAGASPNAYVDIVSCLDVGDTGDIGVYTSTGTLGVDNS